jgi:hypothetical protein
VAYNAARRFHVQELLGKSANTEFGNRSTKGFGLSPRILSCIPESQPKLRWLCGNVTYDRRVFGRQAYLIEPLFHASPWKCAAASSFDGFARDKGSGMSANACARLSGMMFDYGPACKVPVKCRDDKLVCTVHVTREP